MAPRVNSLQESDINRISDPLKTEKEWQKTTILEYASSSRPSDPMVGAVDGEMEARVERVHCGTTSLDGRSDTAYVVLAEVRWTSRPKANVTLVMLLA